VLKHCRRGKCQQEPLTLDRELFRNRTGFDEVVAALGKERLRHLAGEHGAGYSSAGPFPHTMIDGLLPKSFLRAAASEIPELTAHGCRVGSQQCFQHHTSQFHKSVQALASQKQPHLQMLQALLKSRRFVRFLEQLTGIQPLLIDPGNRGSGIHTTASGGSLAVHADFNRERGDAMRRVNTFFFFNHEWVDSWGGHLELWDRNLSGCQQRIRPDFGRFVVFTSNDFSYHGHPTPLQTPRSRMRRSLATYYYTNDRPASECIDGDCNSTHGVIWKYMGDEVLRRRACAL